MVSQKRTIEKITLGYSKRGLSMLELYDFIGALKITWIHRIYLNNDAPWVNLASYYIKTVSKLFLLEAHFAHKI